MSILETLSHPGTLVFAWAIIAMVGAFFAAVAGTLSAAWLFGKTDIIDSFKDDLKG